MRKGSLWMRLFPALWMRWAISIMVGATDEEEGKHTEGPGAIRAEVGT